MALLFLSLSLPALAQYQTNPTQLFPTSANPPNAQKGPPKNKVISTQDKQKNGIPLRRPDKFYPINQNKPIPLSPSNRLGKPVTVWKNTKKVAYPSLYQDPSN